MAKGAKITRTEEQPEHVELEADEGRVMAGKRVGRHSKKKGRFSLLVEGVDDVTPEQPGLTRETRIDKDRRTDSNGLAHSTHAAARDETDVEMVCVRKPGCTSPPPHHHVPRRSLSLIHSSLSVARHPVWPPFDSTMPSAPPQSVGSTRDSQFHR